MPDGSFDIEGMLAAAGQGKLGAPTPPPVQSMTPQFPTIPPHPAPGASDASMAMTNLSDEDYARLMRGEAPTGGVVARPTTPFDIEGMLKAAGEGKLPAVAAAQQTPAAAQQQPPRGFWETLAGSTAATLDALPRGAAGNALDWLNAGLQTPFRMVTADRTPEGQVTLGLKGPGEAFSEGLASAQARHERLRQAYPIASIGGELQGALGTGMAAAPALAYKALPAGAALLPRMGNVADYLARNAAFGGAVNMSAGGDPWAGAAIGGGAAAAIPGLSKLIGVPSAIYRHFAPLWSPAARESSVAATLQRDIGGLPIQTSPTGPLDLAQATGSPAVAAKVRYAQGVAPTEAQALKDAQAAAARGQIAQIGAPATQAEASASGTGAIRDLAKISRDRERMMWNHPALTDFALQTATIKQAMQAALRAVQADDPGLLLGMVGGTRAALNGIAKLPERANLQNINSFISSLKAIARRPPPENPRAGALAARLLSSAEKSLDATVSSSGAPPAIQSAYQAARDFTRQRATILGTQDMRAVLARNPAGVYTHEPSEALRRFFNFSNGSQEGPQNLQQLIEFADEIKGAVLGRGGAEQIGAVRDQLRDAARSYVAAALTKAARLEEGQNFNPKMMQDFLRANAGWMQKSGLLQRPQIQATQKLIDYAGMLRRTEGLNPQGGPATQSRQVTHKTFIDEIMNPWVRHLGEIALGLGGLHTHGGTGGLMMGAVAMQIEKAFVNAETAMRELMAAAVSDAQVAKDLMMRASPGNTKFLSPQTRELLGRVRLAIQADVAPKLLAAPSPAPLQVRQ